MTTMNMFQSDYDDWNEISAPLASSNAYDDDEEEEDNDWNTRESFRTRTDKNVIMRRNQTSSRKDDFNSHPKIFNYNSNMEETEFESLLMDETSPLVTSNPSSPRRTKKHHHHQKRDRVRRELKTSGLYHHGPSAMRTTMEGGKSSSVQSSSYEQNLHSNTDLDHAGGCGGGIYSLGCCCCQCVRTQEVGIVEYFGNFQRIIFQPGFQCIAWPCTSISGRLSLRIQQLDIKCETKTKDNVFIHITVSVQYRIISSKSYEAYYRLTDPKIQIKSYVYDVVRSTVPKMELDETFLSKSSIASQVHTSLYTLMKDYGYEIMDTLIVDISPNEKIKSSMNAINASKRLKEAMKHKAESGRFFYALILFFSISIPIFALSFNSLSLMNVFLFFLQNR